MCFRCLLLRTKNFESRSISIYDAFSSDCLILELDEYVLLLERLLPADDLDIIDDEAEAFNVFYYSCY